MEHVRRPTPPPGFKPFNYRRMVGCPNCGHEGTVWQGGGWQDPGAQALFDSSKGRFNSYEVICQEYEGVMLKCHWSRWNTGECMGCGCEYWQDWVDGPKAKYPGAENKYYYRPRETKTLDDFFGGN